MYHQILPRDISDRTFHCDLVHSSSNMQSDVEKKQVAGKEEFMAHRRRLCSCHINKVFRITNNKTFLEQRLTLPFNPLPHSSGRRSSYLSKVQHFLSILYHTYHISTYQHKKLIQDVFPTQLQHLNMASHGSLPPVCPLSSSTYSCCSPPCACIAPCALQYQPCHRWRGNT